MAAPTLVTAVSTSFTQSTAASKSFAAVSIQTGDVLVVLLGSENGSATAGIQVSSISNSGTAQTWTQRQNFIIDDTWATAQAWTAVSTVTDASFVVSMNRSSPPANQFGFGGTLLVFRGSSGVGSSTKGNASTGDPALTMTSTQANSAYAMAVADWNATTGTVTWATVNGNTPTQDSNYADGTVWGFHTAHVLDVGTVASKTMDETAPTGQKWGAVLVEVKGSSGLSATVGVATETDTATALGAIKTLAVGQTSETDTSQAISAGRTYAVGQVSEADTATSVNPVRPISVGQVTETDTADIISRGGQFIAVGQVSETDSASSLSIIKSLLVGLASETDTANGLTVVRPITVGQTTETDSSTVIAVLKALSIGQALETDAALPISLPVVLQSDYHLRLRGHGL